MKRPRKSDKTLQVKSKAVKPKPRKELRGYKPASKGIKNKFLRWWQPHKLILINMELSSGQHTQFLADASKGTFKRGTKRYVIDNSLKSYNASAKLFQLDYHEEFTLAVQRQIPVGEIKKSIESTQLSEIEYATSPSTLERFVVSKIAEGIMKGQQIDDFLKQFRLLLIITCVAVVGHLLLFMFKTGMFQQVGAAVGVGG